MITEQELNDLKVVVFRRTFNEITSGTPDGAISAEEKTFETYDVTRGQWHLVKNRAEQAKYALAVYNNAVIEVFEIAAWFDAGETLKLFHTGSPIDGRVEFVGKIAPADIRNELKGKQMPSSYKNEQNRHYYGI